MNSPAPTTAGGAPATSYKINVNRTKTKRWRDAEPGSYDGGDWGEVDEYDEYDDYEPGPALRPTGLRQQGQSTASTSGNFQGRQELVQSPTTYTEQTYIAPGGKPSQLHQSYNEQVLPSGPAYQPFDGRANTLSQGDERRAYSAGSSQYGVPGSVTGNSMPYQQNQNAYQGPSPIRGPVQPIYQQPTQSRGRPSLDGQSQPLGAGPSSSNYRGVSYSDRPRLDRDGSRSQSMTSSTSSVDFHTRRDFSPSAMPQPLQTQPRDLPPRKSSLSQDEAPKGLGGSFPSSTMLKTQSSEASEVPTSTRPPDSRERIDNPAKPLPFVRPSDIYKRMAEEREKERLSHESSRPSMEAILGPKSAVSQDNSPIHSDLRQSSENNGGNQKPRLGYEGGEDSENGRRLKPALDTVVERKSEYGMEGISIDTTIPKRDLPLANTTIPQETATDIEPSSGIGSSPRLPPVPRMSGFGSFLGSMNESLLNKPDVQIEAPLRTDSPPPLDHTTARTTRDPALQHQPSLGFRSAVQQAFEDQVPRTPSSAAGSAVARSNSESTNGISPIISRAPSAVTASVRARDADNREYHIPIIAEESTASTTRRPGSGDTVNSSKATTRKPPPTQSSRPDSSESLPTPILTGHRRNISTPSPDNSPARTPAVEVNRQLRQPQEVELAMATPTSVTHSSSSASNAMPARLNLDHEISNDSTPVTKTASTDRGSELPELYAASVQVPGSLTDSGQMTDTISPLTQERNTPGGRAESPSKGRVRDLADKFESKDISRRGSESSMKGNFSGTNTGRSDETPVARPPADRLESFRPHIPGGWESYTSTAPLPRGLPSVSESQRESSDLSIPHASGPNEIVTDVVSTSSGNMTSRHSELEGGLSSNEGSRKASENSPPLATDNSILSDPVTALAAAGTALAGALAAAVGMNQTGSESTAHVADKEANVDDAGRNRRSASLKAATFHPEALKAFIPLEDDSASSMVPTPHEFDDVDRLNESDSLTYFPPVVPLKQKPRDIRTGNNLPEYTRPQFLPSLSTEASPNDYESDRLRKQLVRELSPQAEHFPEERTVGLEGPQAENSRSDNSFERGQGHDSMVIPQEYESYWDSPNQSDKTSSWASRPDAAVAEVPEVPSLWENKIADDEPASSDADVPQQTLSTTHTQQKSEEGRPDTLHVRPTQLTHRFSWEPEPEQIDIPTQQASDEDYNKQTAASLDNLDSFRPGFADPSAIQDSSGLASQTEKQLPEAPMEESTRPTQPTNAVVEQHLEDTTEMANSGSMDSAGEMVPLSTVNAQATIPAFREILALRTPVERIQAFKATREQFAHMSTGLDEWISEKVNDLPEHAELATNGGIFGNPSGYRPLPSRGKFPGLRAASGQVTQQQPYYQQYLNASSQATPTSPNTLGISHATESSTYSPASASGKVSAHPMQSKGKDLLHSAGIFGGKANVAAKGFFSKGKNKFRGSGGADKATPPISFAPDPDLSPGMQPQPLTSLPNFEHHREVPSDTIPNAILERSSQAPSNLRPRPAQPTSSRIANNLTQPQTYTEPVSPLYNRVYHTGDGSSTRSPAGATRYSIGEVSALEESSRPASVSPESSPTKLINPGSSYPDPHTPTREGYRAKDSVQRPIISPVSVSTELRSPSSSNRTPTQLDFLANDVGTGLSSASRPLLPITALPTGDTSDKASYNLKGAEQSVSRAETDRSTPSIAPNIDLSATTVDAGHLPLHDRNNKYQLQTGSSPKSTQGRLATPVRSSEDSEGTFHTADSGEEFEMRHQPSSATAVMPISLPRRSYAPSGSRLAEEVSTDVDRRSNKSASADSTTTGRASSKTSRPFSFISFGQVPIGDLTLRGLSTDNSRAKLDKDLPLTPMTPQQSTSEARSQSNVVPSHTRYDSSEDGQNISNTSRRSYSRPFQDPNLSEHPAFRQEESGLDATNVPSGYYPPHLRRDQAMIQQTTEYQLEGIGPPPTEEVNAKPRSRRSSRGSALFKRLSTPPRQDPFEVEPKMEVRPDPSPATELADLKRKKKRHSLFRSLTGHSGGHDTGNSLGVSVEPPYRAQTDLQRYATTVTPSQSNQTSPRNQQISQSSTTSPETRKQFQRNASYGTPEQGKGKKKRFSDLGTLFGRISPKQPGKAVHPTQAVYTRGPSQQTTPPNPSMVPNQGFQDRQVQPALQRSAQVDSNQGYHEFEPPPSYDRAPLEGYYSPDRKEENPYADHTVQQRSMSNPIRPLPQAPVPSSQNQVSRQQPHYWPQPPTNPALHTPTKNTQSYPVRNTSREPSQGDNSARNPSINVAPNGSPSYQVLEGSMATLQPSNQAPPAQGYSPFPKPTNGKSNAHNTRPFQKPPLSRYDSPPPPTPPPKDNKITQGTRLKISPGVRPTPKAPEDDPYNPPEPARRPSQIRQTLPLLKTSLPLASVSTNKPITPEEIRKLRQKQIEESNASPSKHAIAHGYQPRKLSDDEKIVMMGTSYPGQEWQPNYGNVDE